MKKTLWLLVPLVLMTMPSAFAEVGSKPLVGHFAFGWVEPQGRAADAVDPGWNFSGGATLFKNPQRPVGMRLDFAYNWFYATQQTLESANGSGALSRVDDGYAGMTTLTLDATYDFNKKGKIGGYVGLGMYSRYWQLTYTTLVSGIYCDPWTGW